jgi:diadenosine tetraphosphate (Ap4A) HIT family hydrolase
MVAPPTNAAVSDCFFCAAYLGDDVPWYDRPLMTRPDVGLVLAAVGALVPGYVLVAPAVHEVSVQRLAAERAAEFVDFLSLVISQVERRFGPTTIFEHGSCGSVDGRRSACIAHSHVHLVPGRHDLDALRLPTRTLDGLSGLVTMAPADRFDGYLMYQEPGGPVCYTSDAHVSQYFRRHIAHHLGRSDEWDYVLFPEWDNVRATQEAFSVRPASRPEPSEPVRSPQPLR